MSRLRSGRGANPAPAAKPARGASRPAARPGVYVQSPKPDIYVALLGVALGAMVLGVLLLVGVMSRYGFSTKVSAIPAASAALV